MNLIKINSQVINVEAIQFIQMNGTEMTVYLRNGTVKLKGRCAMAMAIWLRQNTVDITPSSIEPQPQRDRRPVPQAAAERVQKGSSYLFVR